MRISSLLKEPLLHLLHIGMLLFLLYGQVAPPSAEGNRITVSRSAGPQLGVYQMGDVMARS